MKLLISLNYTQKLKVINMEIMMMQLTLKTIMTDLISLLVKIMLATMS